MKTQNVETRGSVTPQKALDILREGNKRFINNLRTNRNLLQLVNETAEQQFPFACILSCSDSRISNELIFDQGLGDVFSIRLAGNIASVNAIGSMEYACQELGAKLIVVMGHTDCSAVGRACDGERMGNLNKILSRIRVAVAAEKETVRGRTSGNKQFVNNVALLNVENNISVILQRSPILRKLVMDGELDIVGAMYDVETGKVQFLSHDIPKIVHQHHTQSTPGTVWQRLAFYMNPFDGRYEDLKKGNMRLNVIRDLTAGLIVAMVAIPLAMGFAMASGLRPEQGIVGGAVAGLLGALFGGSKYQVYGPTAAFIPVIGGLMAVYSHSFLVLVSILAGVLLMIMGIGRFGRIVSLVPHSIVVGFTIGIAVVIAFSQLGEVLGFKEKIGYGLVQQIQYTVAHLSQVNFYAFILAGITFVLCKTLLKVSVFIPAPLIALAFGWIAGATFWKGQGLILIKDKYGAIPTDFGVLTPPVLPALSGQVVFDIVYYVLAILIVAAIESLLCSRMADRMANNTGLPFNPNKELWGQGIVNIVTPLFNGFPHTGALARTAVNIRLGALSPLAGVAKFTFKLLLAAFLASYLEQVPMACIGGILLYVAQGMVKKKEIRDVLQSKNLYHIVLMVFTAVLVPLWGFMPAVLSAIAIYMVMVFFRLLDNPLHRKIPMQQAGQLKEELVVVESREPH